MSHYTTSELMIVCISRELEDADFVAQGIATPLVGSAIALAKKTHAPDLTCLFPIGCSITYSVPHVSLTHFEDVPIGECIKYWDFTEACSEILPKLNPKEFFRPAQVDRFGNFNNVVIGDYHEPKIRLPGGVGIPDVTNYSKAIYMYIPRHNPKVFVDKVDFISGIGLSNPEREVFQEGKEITGEGPRKIITDLCVLHFQEAKMAVESIHPGVDVTKIIRNTGFELHIPENFLETRPPTEDELDLIRREIDPFGVRDIELLDSKSRLDKIHEILELEKEYYSKLPK